MKQKIILEIREIINDYQKFMSKDIEQSLKNLIDYIEGLEDERWVNGTTTGKK